MAREDVNLFRGERDPSFVKGALIPWAICFLSALFYFYDFFLRVAPSVMIHPLMKQFNVGATEIGFISAFYYYAYTPLQIPSGVIVDRRSTRMVLTLSALMCTVGALIFATFPNLLAAFIGRTLMGVGSAFAFIGSLKLAALWLPKKTFCFICGYHNSNGNDWCGPRRCSFVPCRGQFGLATSGLHHRLYGHWPVRSALGVYTRQTQMGETHATQLPFLETYLEARL